MLCLPRQANLAQRLVLGRGSSSGDASVGGGPGVKAVSAAGAAPAWLALLSQCSTSWVSGKVSAAALPGQSTAKLLAQPRGRQQVLDGPGTKHGRLLGKRPGGQLCGRESALQCSHSLVNLQCSENCLDVDRGSAMEVEKSFPPHWLNKTMCFPLLSSNGTNNQHQLFTGGRRAPGEPRGARPSRRLCLHSLLRGLHLLCCGAGTGSGLGRCCSCRG